MFNHSRYPVRSATAASAASAGLLLLLVTALFPVFNSVAASDLKTAAAQNSTPIPVFTETVIKRILAHGPWPPVMPADPGNELSGLAWAESIGKKLFNDNAMSDGRQFSCASCHKAELGFSDGIALAQGVRQHVRNTQGLLNVGLQRWFGWDGGADSLWAATLRPLLSDIEMNADIPTVAQYLRSQNIFSTIPGRSGSDQTVADINDEALLVLASKAIAAYMRTLRSEVTPFDLFRNALAESNNAAPGQYPISAMRGAKLFFDEANCYVCHFGANFSNSEFHDVGRPFFTGVGQVDPGRYTGIKRVREDPYNLVGQYNTQRLSGPVRKTTSITLSQINFGQWRTPSLRNLTLTAPYMHDGSLATLRDVVDAYADIDPARLHSKGESIIKPLALDDNQREDLVAFLRSLSAADK
ncbi:hypothetical protein AB833_09610 [Chromatiales bacterium (ex Bugula neritina AB1)]|nr:hypothetical protein AB833_09610 [Chromatiales bacterium (ex Bugula neritina AB1)]